MSLLLKILPIFPFVDKEFVLEAVKNSKNDGLFNWVVIEYIYRAFIEITLFQIIWHYKHQTKKSKIRDIFERIGISFGLILWNFIGFSTNVFKISIGSPGFSFIQYVYYNFFLAHLLFFANIYIIFLLISAAKKGNESDERKSIFYKFYLQGLIFKLFIDGRLFGFVLNNSNFLIDEEARLYSFCGFFMKIFLNVKWSIRVVEGMTEIVGSLIIIPLVILGYIMINVFFKAKTLLSPIIKKHLRKPTKDCRITEYYGCTVIMLLASTTVQLVLAIYYVFGDFNDYYSINLYMAMDKLFQLGTLPLFPLWYVCSKASRGKTDLSVLYLLYGYGQEEELQEQEDPEKQQTEKREIDDKDLSTMTS